MDEKERIMKKSTSVLDGKEHNFNSQACDEVRISLLSMIKGSTPGSTFMQFHARIKIPSTTDQCKKNMQNLIN